MEKELELLIKRISGVPNDISKKLNITLGDPSIERELKSYIERLKGFLK